MQAWMEQCAARMSEPAAVDAHGIPSIPIELVPGPLLLFLDVVNHVRVALRVASPGSARQLTPALSLARSSPRPPPGEPAGRLRRAGRGGAFGSRASACHQMCSMHATAYLGRQS